MKRISTAVMLSILVGVLAGCQTWNTRSVQSYRDGGDRAFARGEYTQAAVEYAAVVDRMPSDWRARVDLAKTLLVQEKPVAAREHLEVAHNIQPRDEEVVDLLAQAMLESDDEASLFSFLHHRTRSRRTVGEFMRLGFFAERAGDVDEAERAYLTAARLDGGLTVEPQVALADLYAHSGDEEAAIRRLRMASYIEPENPQIRERLRALGMVPGPTLALEPDEAN